MNKNQNGFSLIELLIVVAIILVISAIAIPNLLRSQMSANESSAVGSIRTLNTAFITYSSTYSDGFPNALSDLQPSATASSTAADLVDDVLASGTKSGYAFVYTPGAPVDGVVTTYTLAADPVAPNQTGIRYFFTDESGVIRQNVGAAADISSSPIS